MQHFFSEFEIVSNAEPMKMKISLYRSHIERNVDCCKSDPCGIGGFCFAPSLTSDSL